MIELILTSICLLLLCTLCIGVLVFRHVKQLTSNVERLQHDRLPCFEQTIESKFAQLVVESGQTRSALSKITDESLPKIEQDTRAALSQVTVLTEQSPQFDSPVTRLTFEESLRPNSFAEAAERAARDSLSTLLAQSAGDGIQFTLQSVRLTQQGAEMVVSASAHGQKLLDQGIVKFPRHKLSKARLPQLVDARTGQVVEKLKEMPVSGITSKLATVSGAVVSAAHLIAGADLAKRMVRIESKLDRLLALHRVDQLAKLERIYISARELASQPMDRACKFEMWRLRQDLRELRSAWRQELTLKLNQIDDPSNDGWLKQLFSRQRSVDQKIVENITLGEAEVALMQYSMRLEHVLAIGSDSLEGFIQSQGSEIGQLDGLNRLLREKSSYISGKSADLSAEPMSMAVSALVADCRELLPLEEVAADADVRPTIRSTPTGR